MNPIDASSPHGVGPGMMENLVIWRASHVGPTWDPTWDKVINSCGAAVLKPGGPHCVTHISNGVQDLEVDVLGIPDLRPLRDLDHVEDVRQNCRSAARLVSMLSSDQSSQLEEVRTGRLIRVVVHTEGGAIYCYSVLPDQYIVGFRFDPSPKADGMLQDVRPIMPKIKYADEVLAVLVGELRRQVGLHSQNPGGFEVLTRSALSHDINESQDLPGSDTVPHFEGAYNSISELCQAAVDPDSLQLVSFCRGGRLEILVDFLENEKFAPYFTLMAVDARRKFYADLALELPHMLGPFRRLARSTVGGQLRRVVLDVEQGAIYYYRLNATDYLVGVALDQNKVSVADENMALLADRCRVL